ncbi:ATP-binding cassette domain-containing protein [Streptomyces albiflavescens]|uniref:ATP-binding cassette domain-containing protein n=1 Tax=Streptomyces albiflavescens TaxID=1623582 RepID=UPI00166EA226
MGSSECGKTTLLRMINGMVEPDSGRVLLPTMINVGAISTGAGPAPRPASRRVGRLSVAGGTASPPNAVSRPTARAAGGRGARRAGPAARRRGGPHPSHAGRRLRR